MHCFAAGDLGARMFTSSLELPPGCGMLRFPERSHDLDLFRESFSSTLHGHVETYVFQSTKRKHAHMLMECARETSRPQMFDIGLFQRPFTENQCRV